MTSNSENMEVRSSTPFTLNGMDIYYTKNAFPTTGMTILSINYYDSYPTGAPALPAQILSQEVINDTAASGITTKSLPLASYVKNIEDNNWTKNYSWYDKKGRVIGVHSLNYLGGYTKTETELDFAGVVKKSSTYHLRKQGEIGVTLQERFVYDGQNRLLQHYHKVNDNDEVLLAENTYNDLSQLSNKKVGNNLQSIDYAYNIRGWLTGINRDQMPAPDLGGKLFSYKIKYNEKEGISNPDQAQFPCKEVVAKYNGNIAEVDWRSVENIGNNPSTTPKRYGYVYDKLNRLTAGFYQTPNNPNLGENTESMGYDLNGNITSLFRTSVLESGNATPTKIDDLEYIYDAQNKSNKFIKINDNSYNPTGYEGGGMPIQYDANGNMTEMPDKTMNMRYNYLNLPSVVNMMVGFPFDVEYSYRADGIKLRKKSTSTIAGINTVTTTVKETDYLDGFQYNKTTTTTHGGGGGPTDPPAEFMAPQARAMEMQAYSVDSRRFPNPTPIPVILKNEDLEFFPTAEGFYDYQKDQYIYQYKDHLGNARISFGRDGAGNLELVDVNDYYPFGMNHLKSGNAFFGAGSYKNYKYNGKELQEIGMYDYGARFYMPDIGRWGVIDAYSEKYTNVSNYNYTLNNPIRYIDPDGNVIRIYYGMKNQFSSDYEYKEDRDYSQLSPYLADTYKVLDALYKSANIEIDGNKVNMLQTLIDDKRELSIFDDHKEGTQTRFRNGVNKEGNYDPSNQIGSVNFKTDMAVLFDDVNDLDYDRLQEKYNDNDMKGLKVSTPLQTLGHELGHAYGYTVNGTAHANRQADLSTKTGSPYFRNAEEKRVNEISQKIDMNLQKVYPNVTIRKNHMGFPVTTMGPMSSTIKRK